MDISGTVEIDASLRSSTLSWRKMIRNLNGDLAINFTEGEIKGIDLPTLLLAQPDENGIVRPLDENGETRFSTFTVKAFINQGIASLSKGHIQSEDMNIQIFGNADIYAGSLALTAQQVSQGTPSPKRLLIGGTFKVPLTALERGPDNTSDASPDNPESGLENSVSN